MLIQNKLSSAIPCNDIIACSKCFDSAGLNIFLTDIVKMKIKRNTRNLDLLEKMRIFFPGFCCEHRLLLCLVVLVNLFTGVHLHYLVAHLPRFLSDRGLRRSHSRADLNPISIRTNFCEIFSKIRNSTLFEGNPNPRRQSKI